MSSNSAKTVKIAVVDDHNLFRNGLSSLIRSFGPNYEVVSEASGGNILLCAIAAGTVIDVVLMDVTMHNLDGFETTRRIKENYSSIRVIALTMHDDERTLMKMITAGAFGYLVKDVEAEELRSAIDTVAEGKYHYNYHFTGRIIHSLQNSSSHNKPVLKETEKRFLELACSELTYKEIADKMYVNIKTIEGYSSILFKRFAVRSRVGLVLYAIKNKLVQHSE